MKLIGQNHPTRYGLAVAVSGTGLLMCFLLTPALGADAALLIFILGVAVSALFGGFGPGILATLLSIIPGGYFFIERTGPFIPQKASDFVRPGLFVVTGVLISYISHLRFRAVHIANNTQAALRESKAAVSEHEERVIEAERATRRNADRRWRENEILREISRRLVGRLKFEDITAIVCRAARDLTGADGAAFVLHEEDQVFYADESAILPLWKGQRFPIKSCISGMSMIERKAIAIDDVYADERVPIEAYRPTFVKSMAMMPIGPGDPIGAIGVYWAKHYGARKDELLLLQSLAALADLALLNAKSYEEALAAREQAEQASQLKDEFLATVSHELRSPLNAVMGWASMLLKSKTMPEAQRETALETIERNSKALALLVEDLLDVSRIISGKLRLDVKPLNLSELINQTVENIRPTAGAKNITISLTNNFPEALVRADAERIRQIIFNLLSNAIKFTQEDGLIDVSVNRKDSHFEIRVTDNGRGISKEFLPYVFDRFRQAERITIGPRAGLGLGLAIVKNLVEAHGGEIRAESEGEEQGATFTVTIPVAMWQSDLPEIITPVISPIRNLRLEGLRILMVDDDPDVRDVVKAVMEEHGAVVLTASSAAEAMNLFQINKPDVVISDITMPEENGYQFIRRLRLFERKQGGKETPAVALTAKARVEDRLEALTAGFQMHVPKPIEPAELEVIVASLVAREQIH